ncbi:MAG: GNAT family N-acetyltransferase, partial [Clostridia bacterium]|nr:GNAT family N-acetyltransferase [Clostridia bacterium]
MDFPIDLTNTCIETERLTLRPFRQSDLDDFFAYASVEGVGEAAGWPHHTSKEISQMVLDDFINEKNILAVVYKASGRVVGSLGLHKTTLPAVKDM